jgi:hypothetical protein
MPRKRNLDRSIPLTLKLPESVRTRLDLHLFSDLEGRVAQGSYQQFFLERIQEYFSWRRLDLAPFGFGLGYFVSGPKDMIEALERKLKNV